MSKKRRSKKSRRRTRRSKLPSARERELAINRLRSAYGSEAIEIVEYEITYEPIEDKSIPPEVQERIEELYDLISDDPRRAIPILKKLREQYPEVPVLGNYLTVAYMNAGETEKATEAIKENYEQFPTYLFARCNYARWCIREGHLDEIPRIFNNTFDLKSLYPDRSQFHISEFANFASVMGQYFYWNGQREIGRTYYDMLKEVAPRHPLTRELKSLFRPGLKQRALLKMVEHIERRMKASGTWPEDIEEDEPPE